MAVTLDLDGSVEKINAKLTSTRDHLLGVADGYEKIGEASKGAITGATKAQDGLASSSKKTATALNDQGKIVKQLEGYLKKLETGQKKAQDPKIVQKYNSEIVKTKAALQAIGASGVAGIQGVSKAATASKGVFNGLRATLATTFAPLFAIGAAVQGIRQIITLVSEYEQTAADLQAITGVNAETLDFLKQSAVEVGITTTISAAQTLEAYKLIASAKPELLANAEGLASITREAVALTEAMGGDLPTAATNLTDIMNQFNAPAEEAGRYVNALAAGSKEGSAEVGQLAAAILVAGTEAQSSNVSFEESVGLLEALAEKGKKGAEAGTGLRNILSKLSATDILPKDAQDRLVAAGVNMGALSDKSLSFTDRLRALKPIQEDSNALTAVFGLENKAVAQILIGTVDRVDDLTAAVTGTNTAYEQAATRTATLSGEWTRLGNTAQALTQNQGTGLNGFLIKLVRAIRLTIVQLSDAKAYLSGWFAYFAAGLAETGNNLSDWAGGIGTIFKEAFSFKKLFTQGTGDLKEAINNFKTTQYFGDAGEKAALAFDRAFEANKKGFGTAAPGDLTGGTPPKSTGPTGDTPEDIKKRAAADAKAEEQRVKDINRVRLAAMADGRDKELALEEARFTDLMAKLEEYGLDSTDAVYQNELNKFNIKQKFLAEAADLEGLSGQERIQFLYDQTKAELAAVEKALKEANGGEVTKTQAAQLNLLKQNAAEEYLKQIGEFNTKELEGAQQHEINLLELRASEFETAKKFEEFKQAEILKIRLKYAEKQLELLSKTAGAEDNAVLALKGTINSIKGDLEALAAEGNTAQGFNLYTLIGLDPNDPENAKLIKGIDTAASTALDVYSQITASRLASAEAAVKAKDTEIKVIDDSITAKERELTEQLDLEERGYANSAEAVRRDIELLKLQKATEKAERQKAFEETKKIQKQQAFLDTLTQGSSLITAAAQVFQSVAAIPFLGPAIGAGLVASMIGSFILAKAKVFKSINTQKAKKGMTGTVKGARHSQGGERFGDHIEAEDGEVFGILSRPASRAFGSAYQAFTNAANKGDRAGMAKVAASLAANSERIDRKAANALADKEAKIITLTAEFNTAEQTKELKENNRLLNKIIAVQTAKNTSVEYAGGVKIIRSGTTTRVIKNAK